MFLVSHFSVHTKPATYQVLFSTRMAHSNREWFRLPDLLQKTRNSSLVATSSLSYEAMRASAPHRSYASHKHTSHQQESGTQSDGHSKNHPDQLKRKGRKITHHRKTQYGIHEDNATQGQKREDRPYMKVSEWRKNVQQYFDHILHNQPILQDDAKRYSLMTELYEEEELNDPEPLITSKTATSKESPQTWKSDADQYKENLKQKGSNVWKDKPLKYSQMYISEQEEQLQGDENGEVNPVSTSPSTWRKEANFNEDDPSDAISQSPTKKQ